MGLSRFHPYRGGFPFPGTIVERDMLAEGGNVPICPYRVRVPQPTSQRGMMGWPHPSLPLKTLSEHQPVPLLPRRMCQNRRVSHPRACLFAVLSKGARSCPIVSKISSPWVGFCQETLHVGSCTQRYILQWEPSSFWRAQLEEFAFKTSLACVWCPAGQDSHPFPMLPLLSAVAWPSTASG